MNTSEHLFVGSYTKMSWARGVPGKGIYHLTLNPENGALTCLECCSAPVNPSFSVFDSSGTRLYTVNELESAEPADSGRLMTFAVDPGTKTLTLLGTVSACGDHPCYLQTDRARNALYLADYLYGKLVTYALDASGLPEVSDILSFTTPDTVSHLHSAVLSPDGRYLAAADLGRDTVTVYRPLGTGKQLRPEVLCRAELEKGTGPRHIVFSADGTRLYLSCELSSQAAVLEFCPEEPALRPVQILDTCPSGYKGWNACAHIALSDGGRTLFVSNRGHNSIAVFRVAENGLLTLRGHVDTHGETPRSFAADPSGRWLIAANQDSDTLCIFDLRTDGLPVLHSIFHLPSPAHIVFAP